MNEKAKILIIEDEPDIAEAMKIILEAQNYYVRLAFDPEEGFQKIGEEKPDLIILDVMFGKEEKTEGFDYALKVRNNKSLSAIPILMVTAVNIHHPLFHYSPKTDGEYLPVDDFIDKPAQPEDLVQKVEKLLKQKVSKWSNWPSPSS